MPNQYSSDPRRLIGGYIIGLIIGFLFFLLSKSEIILNLTPNEQTAMIISASLSVGVSIFIMAIINAEHAPAAGIALGLVINSWNHITIIFILSAVIWLVMIKTLTKKYLIDLTEHRPYG